MRIIKISLLDKVKALTLDHLLVKVKRVVTLLKASNPVISPHEQKLIRSHHNLSLYQIFIQLIMFNLIMNLMYNLNLNHKQSWINVYKLRTIQYNKVLDSILINKIFIIMKTKIKLSISIFGWIISFVNYKLLFYQSNLKN